MANTKLSQAAPGTIAKINENGAPVEFLILQQGYPEENNGNTLLLRNDCYDMRAWGASQNLWDGNSMDVFLNGEYLQKLDKDVQNGIVEVAMPYVPGGGNWTVSTIQRKVGLLTATELGISRNYTPICGKTIPYFNNDLKRIAKYNGNAVRWWTMDPRSYGSGYAEAILESGGVPDSVNNFEIYQSYGSRPKFCLVGESWELTEDGTLVKASAGGANTPLKDMSPGSLVKAYEDGIATEFYIGTHDYEAALNGAGRTLFVRKDCPDNRQWNSTNVNTYESCTLDAYYNGEYKSKFDPAVQKSMGTTKFYYTPGNGNTSLSTLERAVFQLSATELGFSRSYMNVEGTPLPIASTLQIAHMGEAANTQWTRSTIVGDTGAWYVNTAGSTANAACTAIQGSRPCFTLPAGEWYVDDEGFLTQNPGAGQMFIPASELEQGVEYYFRVFPRNHQNQFQTGIDGSVVTAIPGSAKVMTAVIDLSDSNPATCVSYADDAANMTPGSAAWDEFFGHYPCLFKDGKEVGRLNPNDFSKFADGTDADITSGAAGDVMIAFPRRGVKITTSGTKVTVSMTNGASEDGFSYLAHQRGETNKDVFYLGAYKGHVWNNLLWSLSGQTPTAGGNANIGYFRERAHAKGGGYEQSGFYQLVFRQAMYILKYKNLNAQAVIGMGRSGNNTTVAVTGATNAKGMDFGDTTDTTIAGRTQMKLFGLEDFYGNIYEFIDGVYANPNRQILTATDNFNSAGDGYTNTGSSVGSNISGYLSRVMGTTQAGFVPSAMSGSATTYFSDSGSLSAGALAIFGGGWNEGTGNGVFKLSLEAGPTSTNTTIGSRLMYL